MGHYAWVGALVLAVAGALFTSSASAGATREAVGSFQLHNLVLEDPQTGWYQTVSDNFLYRNAYVRTVGYHGSSIDSRARKGAKQRAANAAIVCMAAFYVNGAGSHSWTTNCDNASVRDILDDAVTFEELVEERICPQLSELAKRAGRAGGVSYSADVRVFADTGGSEGDAAEELGEIRGRCP